MDGLRISGAEFAEAVEFSEGADLDSFKARFSSLDRGEFLFDSGLVQAVTEVVIETGILAFIVELIADDAFVGNGSFEGPSAADAPLGDGDALDQVEFEDGGGLEGVDIIPLELFEKGMSLSDTCRKQLEEAETRVEMLMERGNRIVAEPANLANKK